MEEADIRSAEVKKSSYEFERDIVKGAVNQVVIRFQGSLLCQLFPELKTDVTLSHFIVQTFQTSRFDVLLPTLPIFISTNGKWYGVHRFQTSPDILVSPLPK